MKQISEEDFQFLKDGCHHIMSIAMNCANLKRLKEYEEKERKK